MAAESGEIKLPLTLYKPYKTYKTGPQFGG